MMADEIAPDRLWIVANQTGKKQLSISLIMVICSICF